MTAPDEAKQKLVQNEAAKLTATYLNSVAVGVFIVGGVAPSLTYTISLDAGRPDIATVAIAGVACVVASAGLHSLARRSLRSLKP
ncbi:amino acid transporter protein [Methylopila turkensis]|uniref:Uncharacterized protein n=1 Tax=Methylopila turkensis TaxID=1437816 RepID=A0A9W6JR82_9HYPH|nr:amino acid transporter protein [Methylopila turkensis]GLK81111.1 hypothetical protein GCM10008174_28520 [Methylopila turkensis]